MTCMYPPPHMTCMYPPPHMTCTHSVLDDRWQFTTVHSKNLATKAVGVKGDEAVTIIRHTDSGALTSELLKSWDKNPHRVSVDPWIVHVRVRALARVRVRESAKE